MNWAKYEFSKESESELQEYLQVVAEKSSNFPVDLNFREAWKKYLPLDEEIKEKLKLNVSAPIEVIEIEDDDEEEDATCKQDENGQTNSKTESEDFSLPEQSFMQLLTNEPKVNVTTTEDLLDTVRELLETEPVLPCHIIRQFGSSSLQGQVIEMFDLFAVELNMQCTLKLWKSILESNFLERPHVIKTFLNQILIKKVFTEQDSTLRILFADTWKGFPEETNALMRVHLVNNTDSKIFKNNLRSLPDAHKNTLLKSFTEDCEKLQTHQLDTVASLVTSSLDPKHLKMLIELMFSAAKYFENEKSFGKLLLEVVQCLGVSVLQNEQQINYIIQTHKSIFKAQIVKVYNNVLQDLKLLSQSLRS